MLSAAQRFLPSFLRALGRKLAILPLSGTGLSGRGWDCFLYRALYPAYNNWSFMLTFHQIWDVEDSWKPQSLTSHIRQEESWRYREKEREKFMLPPTFQAVLCNAKIIIVLSLWCSPWQPPRLCELPTLPNDSTGYAAVESCLWHFPPDNWTNKTAYLR